MVIRSQGWARVCQSLALLLLYFVFIRYVPAMMRPAVQDDDCYSTASSAADALSLARCVDRHPEDVALMLDAAAAYERSGDTSRAESMYRKALDTDPKDGTAHLGLGKLLYDRGDRSGAAREAAEAGKTLLGNPEVQDLMHRAASQG
jgi:Flp pilus assembly protein TadD